MPRWIRGGYAAGLAALVTLYFALPDAPRYLWTILGVSSVLALVAGTLVNRPRHRLPWLLVAAGVSGLIAGDTTYDLATGPLGMNNPFPSVADGFYLAMYPLIAAGLLLMVRARTAETDWEALLDALIVTIGLGLPVWVFLAQPYVADSTMSLTEKAFSVAYPFGDVLLLAVLARLVIGAGARTPSLVLLTAGTVGLLSSDVLHSWIQHNGEWHTGGPVDLGWVVFYAALGCAALQPDMVRLAEPERRALVAMSRGGRLLLLGFVSLVAPGLLLWDALSGRKENIATIALASGALFVLVTARLNGLVMRARQSTQRERVLRRSGEALVGASHGGEIFEVRARAVLDLVGAEDGYRVLVAVEEQDARRLVHDSDPVGGALLGRSLQDLIDVHGPELRRHQYGLTESERCGDAVLARLGPGMFSYLMWVVATLGVAGYGLAQTRLQAMAAAAFVSGFEAVGAVAWMTTKQRLVPGHLLGRVSSFDWFISIALVPQSYEVTASAAEVVGTRTTLIGSGVVGALVTLGFLFVPGVRDPDRTALTAASVASAPTTGVTA